MDPATWREDNRNYMPNRPGGWLKQVEELERHDPDVYPFEEKRALFKWLRPCKIKIEHSDDEDRATFKKVGNK